MRGRCRLCTSIRWSSSCAVAILARKHFRLFRNVKNQMPVGGNTSAGGSNSARARLYPDRAHRRDHSARHPQCGRIPKFIDLGREARIAKLEAARGSVGSAAVLANSLSLTQGLASMTSIFAMRFPSVNSRVAVGTPSELRMACFAWLEARWTLPQISKYSGSMFQHEAALSSAES